MKFKCKKCGYEWYGRLENNKFPKTCSRCKRHDWDKDIVVKKIIEDKKEDIIEKENTDNINILIGGN